MVPYKTGYLIDQENRERLRAGSQSNSQFSFGNIDPRDLGKPMGLIDVLNVEDQEQLNSCAGNSITTVAETCLWHQSNGRVKPQLSRMFAYVNGQRVDNINGDNGALLEGCIESIKTNGCPEERFAPYTGQYYTGFTEEAYQNARNFRLLSYAPIDNLQNTYEALARRVGAIYLGIPCTEEYFNSPPDGKLDYYYPKRGDGGHAICIVDWCDEVDENGFPYLLSPGSWGKKYGYKGYRKFKPSALTTMLQHPSTSCYVLSDMQFTTPRYDWHSQKWLA